MLVGLGVAVLLGAAVVAGAALGDGTSDDDGTAAVSPIEEPVAIDADEPDTGVIIDGAPAAAAVEGLPGGTWISEYGPMDAPAPDRSDADANTTTTVPDTTAPGIDSPAPAPEQDAATTPTPAPPGGWGAPSQLAAAVAATRPPPGIAHFVDRCAQEATSGCPAGQPGTITPYEGSGGAPPPLEIRVWPELTKAQYPSLRCDPGYRTGTRVPVVVTTNLPLARYEVTLALRDAGQLDVDNGVGVDPTELTLFQQRQAAGTVGADLANGTHYCFSLATEGDPGNAAVAAAAAQLSPPLQHEVVVHGEGQVPAGAYPTPEATVTSSFSLGGVGDRPPVRFQPLDGYHAQLVVPQGSRYPLSDTGVWIQPAYNPLVFDEPASCVDPSTLEPWSASGALTSDGQPVDAAELARPDYPYDRDYDRNAVWNIVLRSGREYLVCVRWGPGYGDVEGWRVKTPQAMAFALSFGSLTVYDWEGTPVTGPGGLFFTQQYMVRVPGLCWVTGVRPQTSSYTTSGSTITEGYDQNAPVCQSDGWPVGLSTELRLEEWIDEGDGARWHDRGERRVLTPPHCTSYGWALVAHAVVPLSCGPGDYPLTLEWVTPSNSVCGNGLWSSCSSSKVRARMKAWVRMDGALPTDGPLDWTYWRAYSSGTVPVL